MMLLTQLLGLLLLHHNYKLTQGFNECQTAKTCKECIILNPKCSWCNVLEYRDSETKYRHKKCDTVENHKNQQCADIHNPESEANITKDAELDGDVRVSPQEIRIKLRPGQPTNVTIRIKTPKNFPIDLYYLMDLSKSMLDDKANVAKLGDILSKEMKNLTSNFRLGFGGYVDKPLTPYTLTYEGEIKSTLERMKAEEGVDAQYTFSFNNYLPLSDNTKNFASSVNRTKISFNRDSPEGTLDALMQVVVCSDAIGWRNKKQARRIVIVTTDQTFHYSGDGLLGGVVTPNDAVCRLMNNSHYTGWNQFDYPSLSQIRALMLDNQIVPIFASLGNVELYEDVARFFGDESGAIAKRLADDSSNVVPLIKEAYEKIAKKVSITSTAPGDVTVKYFTRCGVDGQALVESASCNNVSIGQEVEFIAQISSQECKPGAANERLFKLKTDFDDVDVALEMVCDCPCKDTRVENSPQCSGNGTLSCGLCECNPLHTGSICSCLKSENTEDKALCAVNKLEDHSVCGGHECDCGECLCPDIFEQVDINEQKTGLWVYIYGQQCECSNATCDFSNTPAQICGGPERGRCDCGKCVCNDNWTGDRCQDRCEQSQAACTSKDGVICGGKGTCVCNKCVCVDGYVGEQCTECIERCPDPCEDFKECVRCLEFDTSELSTKECYDECERWNISTEYKRVDKIPDGQKRCIARDDDDCSYVYTYNKQNETDVILLTVQEGLICPAEPDIVAIILGVIAGIVGIGLALLLIWKLLATIQDRRDFAMFEKDRQNPKWDSGENPIYKEATSTFQNPMFKKSQAS